MRARLPAAVTLVVALLAAACGPASRPATPGASSPPTATGLASPPAPTAEPSTAGPGSSPPASAVPAGPIPTTGSWARVDPAGEAPSAREDHTWTVDADGRLAYLFGGRRGGEARDDLWAFDLAAASWRRLSPAGEGPAARFGHEAQWVTGLGLVVFAGQAGATFFDDLWVFDPAASTWRLLPGAGSAPIPRYGSCSGIGPDGRLWISHGFTADGARFSDTRAYDFAALEWANQSPGTGAIPVERCLHTCWWTADGQLTLYGGQTTGVAALGDLWRLEPGGGGPSTNAWRELPTPAPAARQLPAVARGGAWTLVVGGRGVDRKPLGDAWVLADTADGFAELALDTGDAPSARSGAALVHDAARDRFLLFGGIDDEARDDLWSLTTE